MARSHRPIRSLLYISMLLLASVGCMAQTPGHVLDEAKPRAAVRRLCRWRPKTISTTWMAAYALSTAEIKGRNMWLVWTGGNDRFWDGMTASTFGAFDLLKIVTYASVAADRPDTRWTISA